MLDAPKASNGVPPSREALLAGAERKINLRVLPAMSLISIICYLDRANLSFASGGAQRGGRRPLPPTYQPQAYPPAAACRRLPPPAAAVCFPVQPVMKSTP
jgi:hypothetical protein